MREMVLNHASVPAPDWHTAVEWLGGVAAGIAELRQRQIVESWLIMRRPMQDVFCTPELSLFAACVALLQTNSRDVGRYLMELRQRVPLEDGLDPEIKDRFLACQSMTMTMEDGKPLVLCAIADHVAISFPSNSTWDHDLLTVRFEELLSSGEFEEVSENIDNLARATHAACIHDRHTMNTRNQISNFDQLWADKRQVFPNLTFGADVKEQFTSLNIGKLANIVKVLAILDRDAAAWHISGGPMPSWSGNVSGEGQRVMQNPRLREARRFRSNLGARELFEWHAKFGGGLRIHLRFDAGTHEVEIGYIGQHLPLS